MHVRIARYSSTICVMMTWAQDVAELQKEKKSTFWLDIHLKKGH
jgi:hypothetical protein